MSGPASSRHRNRDGAIHSDYISRTDSISLSLEIDGRDRNNMLSSFDLESRLRKFYIGWYPGQSRGLSSIVSVLILTRPYSLIAIHSVSLFCSNFDCS